MKSHSALAIALLTGISSAVNLGSSIYFGTKYESEAFGILATQFSIATILSILPSWRADYYSIQENTFEEIASFLILAITPIFILSLWMENGPHTALWLYSIALFSACTYKSMHDKNPITIGYFRLLNVVLITLTQLLLTYIEKSGNSLFHGAAIGSLLASTIYGAFAFRGMQFKLNAHQYFIKEAKKLAITSASWLLENLAFLSLPIIGYYLASIEEVGYYSFIDRFFKMPVGILASSIAPILIAKIITKDKVTTRNVIKYWAIIGLAAAFTLTIIYYGVDYVIVLIWGEKWRRSLEYATPLFFFYLAHITFSATNSIYTKFNQFSLLVILQISLLLLIALCVYLASINFESIVAIFSLLYVIYQVSNAACQLYIIRQFGR